MMSARLHTTRRQDHRTEFRQHRHREHHTEQVEGSVARSTQQECNVKAQPRKEMSRHDQSARNETSITTVEELEELVGAVPCLLHVC